METKKQTGVEWLKKKLFNEFYPRTGKGMAG